MLRPLHKATMSSQPAEALHGVEAFVFDVFGTTVDWQGNIVRTLAAFAEGTEGKSSQRHLPYICIVSTQSDRWPYTEHWNAFAEEWRLGYFTHA